MITSTTNNRVKMVRHLQNDRRFRSREQAFVAEGVRWLRDLHANQLVPQTLFYTEQWADEPLVRAQEGLCLSVSDAVMAHMSDVETPSGLLMIVAMPQPHLPENSSFSADFGSHYDAGQSGNVVAHSGGGWCRWRVASSRLRRFVQSQSRA